ncbi:MAG TPA: outer membrane beta-barrel protein [Edaphobacter sp.]
MLTRFLLATALLCTPTALFAQAAATATRPLSLQVGAGFSNADSGYRYIPGRVNGTTIYADLDLARHLGVEGEFRYLKDGRTGAYEKTYEIGPRYSLHYNRFSPYAKGLYGRGVFNFTPDSVPSEFVVQANLAYNLLAVGGGVDYRLLSHVNLRGEYEYQHWFGFPNFPDFIDVPKGLHPSIITVGGAYHF